MTHRIEHVSDIRIIGKSIRMSLADNRTFELWQSFMPERKAISNAIGPELYSIQVYDHLFKYQNFHPGIIFEKWAGVAVSDFDEVPDGMKTLVLKGGSYAVFTHRGPASAFQKTFQFIFEEWLPASAYELDDRAHFELLGPKYKNNAPDSEEDVWIPIIKR